MSTLCAKIKQRARVLAAGAALTAATLAILPGVAEAQALGVKTVGAAQGGKAVVNTSQDFGASVPRVSIGLADRTTSAATVDSSTVATESVATAERPLLDGVVNSTTEAVAPAVPAQATATVNENVAIGDAVNQDVCLNAAFNQAAGSCGGSGGDSGATLGTDAGSIELATPEAAADSRTTVTEHAAASERPLLDGAVNNKTEVAAPSVPAKGAATVDANVAAGDLVNQDVCLNAGVNAPAGECGTRAPAADAPATSGDASVAVEVNEPLVPAKSGTDAAADVTADPITVVDACLGAGINQEAGGCDEQSAPNESGDGADPATADPAVNGDANGSVSVDAPAAPASGGATVDSSAVVDNLAGLDVCLGVGVNQDPSACGDPTAGGNPADGDSPGVGGADPTIDGNVDGSVGVEAPLPTEGAATLDSDATVGELAAASVCINAGVNQDPGACEEPASGDGGTSTDDGERPSSGDGSPTVTGNVNSGIGVDAPAVPAEGATTVDSNTVIDELAAVGICLGAGLNQDPGTCEGGAAPGDQSGDGGTLVDGDSDVTAGVDASAVPAEGGAALDAGAVAARFVSFDACVNAGVNQEPGSCGQAAPRENDERAPDGGGNGSGDGSGDSDSSDDAGQGADLGPNDVAGNSDPTNRGPANGGAPSDGSVAGGDDRGSVGSSSTDAGSPAATDSSSAGTPDSVFLLMSDSAPAGAVPASIMDPGSEDEASSLQASEQGAAATPSADDTTLPDTGGVDPWKAPLGFLLLSLGLLLVARRARRSPLTQ